MSNMRFTEDWEDRYQKEKEKTRMKSHKDSPLGKTRSIDEKGGLPAIMEKLSQDVHRYHNVPKERPKVTEEDDWDDWGELGENHDTQRIHQQR